MKYKSFNFLLKGLNFSDYTFRFYGVKLMLMNTDMKKMEEMCVNLPVLANSKDFETIPTLKQVLEWRKHVSEYILVKSRHTRMRFLLGSYLMIEEQQRNIETNKELAHILGWVTELVRICADTYLCININFVHQISNSIWFIFFPLLLRKVLLHKLIF